MIGQELNRLTEEIDNLKREIFVRREGGKREARERLTIG